MGIFSLLFRKNDIITEGENLQIETIETVSNKIEVVYPSGMLFKSVDSYVPNVDIMEIAVPVAMDIFKEEYTVYSTEKLLSHMFYDLQLNLSLRKEIHLISTGYVANLETFKSIAATEISYLDNSFLDKITKDELDSTTYTKIRQVILATFKIAGKTDPYFCEMNKIFSYYFSEYNEIDKIVSKLKSIEVIENEDLDYQSNVLYIDSPNSANPTRDIMYIAKYKLESTFAKIYDLKSMSIILSKIIYTLHSSIQKRLSSYENNISSIDYLLEIKKAIEEVDLFLIEMIKNEKMDETAYLTLQEVLVESFIEAKTYDLYMEAISTVLNEHVESNNFFKEYISLKVYDIFSDK